jgi:hypothetical protein
MTLQERLRASAAARTSRLIHYSLPNPTAAVARFAHKYQFVLRPHYKLNHVIAINR